jgi:hypothetical protein
MPSFKSRFRYNAGTGEYVTASGHRVSEAVVRREVDAAILKLERDVQHVVAEMRARRITPRAFEQQMAALLTAAHRLAGAAAAGGLAQLDRATTATINAAIADQLGYLKRFAADLASGAQPLDGRLGSRAQLYVRAIRGTFEQVRGQRAAERGMTEERSVLFPADHCEQCVQEAMKSWVPIGSLVPIGQRECLSNDHCDMEYRVGPGALRRPTTEPAPGVAPGAAVSPDIFIPKALQLKPLAGRHNELPLMPTPLSAADPLDISSAYVKAINRDLRDQQILDGNEHLISTQAGRIVGRSNGTKYSVDEPLHVFNIAKHPSANIETHHNHPTHGPLSDVDMLLELRMPGSIGIWAHSSDGTMWAARIHRALADNATLSDAIQNAYGAAMAEARGTLLSLGEVATTDDDMDVANVAADAALQVLARYEPFSINFTRSAIQKARIAKYRELFKKALAAAERAIFPQARLLGKRKTTAARAAGGA